MTHNSKVKVGGVLCIDASGINLRYRDLNIAKLEAGGLEHQQTMIPTLIRRAVQENPVPYIYRNQYKAKRTWPPDFSKLSPRHQFRLERRYRRRTKLKWARPRWTKAVKITQLASVTC